MLLTRVIPTLLLKGPGFVKTTKFKNPVYLGDPLNIVKIFNEKEVDEIVILDISDPSTQGEPNFELIGQIANECFMPVCYGGHIQSIDQIKTLFSLGIEKISLNTAAYETPSLIEESASNYGSQSIVGSIDVKKNLLGKYAAYIRGGSEKIDLDPITYAKKLESLGVGEILLTAIDREGTMSGYDTALIKMIASSLAIPLIANGGARNIDDFSQAVKEGGASAVAASSMFVFHGPQKGVLISYPPITQLEKAFI